MWSELGLLGKLFLDYSPLLFSQIFLFRFYLSLSEQAIQKLRSVVGMIHTVRLNATQTEQSDMWTYCWNSGLFSWANYYKLMFQGVMVEPIFPKIWKRKCVPKMKVFTWLLL